MRLTGINAPRERRCTVEALDPEQADMHDILVRAQTLGHWDEGVVAAALIAAEFGGSLTAVHVVPLGLPPMAFYDPGMLAAAAAIEADRQMREADGHADAFRTWATAMGARHPVWLTATGDASQALEYNAGWHDLLVVRLDPRDDDPWANPGGVGRIAVHARLPTLVLPAQCRFGGGFDTVAVAWNGTPGAARALHAAKHFVTRARQVVVLRSEPEPLAPLRHAFCLQDWLARHRPDAQIREIGDIGDGGEPTGAALLAAARREEAHLLVMGAYGHARFSEWVLGGVTRHVLNNTDRPLLMRH
ncbi:universal stress protein [Lysobacter lacus]|uniref:Universal stress protein n=2 Tax=Cognatilysobacter lacus TaxID=1643323 RepID=A0A5D8Z2I6_9GAMM|nr:universal stress protein [Lysobacter lacus]